MAAGEVLLPLQMGLLMPLVWGLAYLAATKSYVYLVVAVMLCMSFYAFAQAAYHQYYSDQAVAALDAIASAKGRYTLSLGNVSDYFVGIDNGVLQLDTESLAVVIVDRSGPGSPPFLNLRAYLQPQGIFKSIALISPQTTSSPFFLLHELGHLSATSHYAGLYESRSALRLVIAYGPFLSLSPTWTVFSLVFLACLADRFLHGSIRREYIADAFAWSVLARAGGNLRLHARRIATAFRYAKAKSETEALETSLRLKLCQLILDSSTKATPNSWAHDDRWLKEAAHVRLGIGIFTSTSFSVQSLLTVIAILQFDGELYRLAIFVIVAFWLFNGFRFSVHGKAWNAYRRLDFVLSLLPRTSRQAM